MKTSPLLGQPRNTVIRIPRCILIATALFASMFCQAQTSQKPLFVMAQCDGKVSSLIVTALKNAASQKYHLISTVNDIGRRGLVQTIQLICGEHEDVAAIATLFGVAKCKSTKLCLAKSDDRSLNVALCDTNLFVVCGRAIFEKFDAYITHPDRTALKID